MNSLTNNTNQELSELLFTKLSNNNIKTCKKFIRRLKLPVNKTESKEDALKRICKYLVTLEGQIASTKVLPKATCEQLFNCYPPPLVKQFEQKNTPVEIDITNDVEPVNKGCFITSK